MFIVSVLLVVFGLVLVLRGGTLPRSVFGGVMLMAGITLFVTHVMVQT